MTKSTRTFFALSIRQTGELARIVSETHARCYSTQNSYSLTRDPEFPVFEAKSLDDLALVLFENTPGYNTHPELPGWGELQPDELIPVQVTVTQEVELATLPRLLNLRTVSVRDIPYIVARKYAGGDFAQRQDRPGLVFWLAELPPGESLESVRDGWVGKSVFGGDQFSRRHVYACVEVPEDYRDLLQGQNGALLIASGVFYR